MIFRFHVLWVAASVVLGFAVSPAVASPITYTFVQTASGTLDGVAFTNSTVTTTVTADSSNVQPLIPDFDFMMNINASRTGSVTISGLGTYVLLDAFVFSSNRSFIGGDDAPDPTKLYSAVGVGDLDDPPLLPAEGGFTHLAVALLDTATDASLYGYDLTTALGPVTALGIPPATRPTVPPEPVDYSTSGGELVMTSNDGTTTFTAVGGEGDSVSTPGGPIGNPVTLGSNVSQVTGMIGGVGTQAFYRFFWGGGLFSATASVGATDPLAIYNFGLFTQDLGLLAKVDLFEENGFSNTIAMALASGTYTIGIDATNQPDPPFSITFDTPVNGVPEPVTSTLLLTGLFGFSARRFFRRGRHARHVRPEVEAASRAS